MFRKVSEHWEQQHYPLFTLDHEDNMSIGTVSLKYCSYDKNRKTLTLASEFFGGRFPSQFFVRSHHTGKDVRFTTVGPEDKLFDQDQWDGEMQIYRPVGNVTNVDYLVVRHEY